MVSVQAKTKSSPPTSGEERCLAQAHGMLRCEAYHATMLFWGSIPCSKGHEEDLPPAGRGRAADQSGAQPGDPSHAAWPSGAAGWTPRKWGRPVEVLQVERPEER